MTPSPSRDNASSFAKKGSALPVGATIFPDGINFALFARNATSVKLVIDLLSGRTTKRATFPLSPTFNRTGDIWHIRLPVDWKKVRYGYIVDGRTTPELGTFFAPEKILIDPYCKNLRPRKWGGRSEYGKRPLCRVTIEDFEWEDETPQRHPLQDTIIYELHVRGFTQSPTSGCRYPGTYRGVTEKIPYLKELGVTAVELMPVAEFDENDTSFCNPETGERHRNFWGYNSINFFALKSGYAANPQRHIEEFKKMVRAFHVNGIDVILDIVFNHTGEAGYDGNTMSFRGIDNPIYYLLDKTTKEYLNFSGCGNTMNCNHAIVRELIRYVLRYWVTEMHIDGFRFDLASILGRDTDGTVLPDAPMLDMIAEDPVLRDTKIIAEAWDAAGLYQVGSFSTDSRWTEWNGRFRDDIRAFFSGENGSAGNLATRIAGSSDLYQDGMRSPANSINFLTSHDGFTLYDLVSYNEKHNLPNGEENRDGCNNNISWNSGVEGPTDDPAIEELRLRRMKSMAAVLFLSQGVPMITAGDEFGKTQSGNNNAWCQDNETSWIDWSLAEKNSGLLRFFRFCISLRKAHPVFRRKSFFNPEKKEIIWQSLHPDRTDWTDKSRSLAFLLDGAGSNDNDFFIMMNGDRTESAIFTLPAPPKNLTAKSSRATAWKIIMDTARSSPDDCLELQAAPTARAGGRIEVQPMSVVVLQT